MSQVGRTGQGAAAAAWLLFAALCAPLEARAAFGDAAAITDSSYPQQWPLNNTGQSFPDGCTAGVNCEQGTPDADMDWPEAYDLGVDGTGVVIALAFPYTSPVPNTNVKCENPDIAPQLWSDPGDPNMHGWNFYTDSGDPSDVCVLGDTGGNHDTHVAQLALAAVNGQLSVGAAPGAQLMLLGGVTSPTVFYNEALPWAGAHGADILVFPYSAEDLPNPSVCAPATGGTQKSQSLNNSNVLVFWGCTNEFPGCHSAAASVGGTTEDDLPYNGDSCAVISQYVDFAAPSSHGWVVTNPEYGISFALGTAAGAAAFVLSENPALTRAQLLERLKQTADKVGPYAYTGGRNDYYGHGRLNVYRGALVGDVDGDGVPGDGDGSWIVGDDPCAGGTSSCDDNCPVEPNASQTDNGRVGVGGADGIGNACQCGDVTGDGKVLTDDADQIQAFLTGSALTVPGKCNVVGEQGGSPSLCQLDDWVIVRRGALGLPTSVGQICDPALP
jgi:hypothetical protein